MKKFWTIFLVATLVIAISLTLWLHYIMKTYIGEAHYNATIDTTELKRCNPDFIPQYYSTGTDYVGGKQGIKAELIPTISEKITFQKKTGTITIRFIVNCEGETGFFRYNSIDSDLKATSYDSTKVDELIQLVASLKNWNVVYRNDRKYDNYYLINFKIEDGIVTDIH